MDNRATIIAAAIVTIGSLIVAYLTKRSAKDSTVTTGFTNLTSALQKQLDAQGNQIKELQATQARWRRLLRDHEMWDWQMVSKVRSLTDDSVPDPPPLDLWD
jgi:hypothetical protein